MHAPCVCHASCHVCVAPAVLHTLHTLHAHRALRVPCAPHTTPHQAAGARVTDALLNYETVKYFTNEEYEREQYSKAISDYQAWEFKSSASINLLNV